MYKSVQKVEILRRGRKNSHNVQVERTILIARVADANRTRTNTITANNLIQT